MYLITHTAQTILSQFAKKLKNIPAPVHKRKKNKHQASTQHAVTSMKTEVAGWARHDSRKSDDGDGNSNNTDDDDSNDGNDNDSDIDSDGDSDGDGDDDDNDDSNSDGDDGDGDNDSDGDNGDVILDQDEDVIQDAEEAQEEDLEEAVDATKGLVVVAECEQNAASTALSKVSSVTTTLMNVCWLYKAYQTCIQNQQLSWFAWRTWGIV